MAITGVRVFAVVVVFSTGLLGQASHKALVGLDTNPPPSEGSSGKSERKWLKVGLDAGVSCASISPKWYEIEPSPGQYKFSDVDSQSKLSQENGLPVYLNIRIIDTNNRALPESYKDWRFDDPRLADKLRDLIKVLAPRFNGKVRWISIGNEVDSYFSTHKSEITAYRTLLDRLMETVRSSFPGASFTVNFTFNAVTDLQKDYKSIIDSMDIFSFTYYPLNPDFTVRDPEVVPKEIGQMAEAAGNKRLFLQEVGYPSATRLNSSEEKQARFIENVFRSVEEHQPKIIAFHFVWMSDIAQSLVNQFGEYYKLSNSENFKAFLGTLGYFDRDGKPKAAWRAFEQEAHKMATSPDTAK